jgi:hypothetical protein
MISWTLEPESAPGFTPAKVHGDIEITGKMVELDCVWEYRVSPFEGFQPLALPAPLEGLQGYDDSELDPQGTAGISVRFNWPFADHPSTGSWDDAEINIGVDGQWTQVLHDNVSRGDFRSFAVLYGLRCDEASSEISADRQSQDEHDRTTTFSAGRSQSLNTNQLSTVWTVFLSWKNCGC